MEINLSEPNPLMTKLTKTTKRNQFIYEFLGQIQSLQKRTNPKYTQHFYQLNLNCLNNSAVKRIFVFESKLKNKVIWNVLQTNAYLGKKYLFSCRNYYGSYYLVDWKEVND